MTHPDIERQWQRMIAGVRRVMARRAGALDGGGFAECHVVVETAHRGDAQRCGIEERLACSNVSPRLVAVGLCPGRECRHDVRAEGLTGGLRAQ